MKVFISTTTISCFLMLSQLVAIAAPHPLMRISLENTETHVQTRMVELFVQELREKLKDTVAIEFYANARLFRDKEVIQALSQGKVEMAVPGTWHVMNYEPNIGVFLLPFFYGRAQQVTYQVVDGDIGKAIDTKIENKLQIKVIGRWLDLGYAHLFSMSKKIERYEDIQGLRVRVAGGVANEYRIKALGGVTMIVPWPDLPAYMEQGRIDAVLTSYETVQSAHLDRKGLHYAFEDREYFPQYIPMMRGSFWNKLSAETRKIIQETWEKHVDFARQQAAVSQEEAKKTLIKNGLQVVVPGKADIEKWRNKLSASQDDFVKAMNIDPDIIRTITDNCKCE
jgi:TRAP-type C4-dicarboxylate transport system substrate-binding protein